jgi:hypothetical protein
MSNTLKIIARVRERTDTGTNYAVSKALGITQSNLDRILKEEGYLGDKAQREAAKLLGIAFDDINALVNEDKAKSDADRAYWRSLYPEGIRAFLDIAGKAAAIWLLATALNLSSVNPADAAQMRVSAELSKLPIMRHWLQRFRRWLGAFASCSGALAGPIPRVTAAA